MLRHSPFLPALATALLCAAFATRLLAAPPAWWSDVNAKVIDDTPGVPHDISANYAPANLGQLKHIAAMAKRHLDDKLDVVGGAGQAINDLVAGFQANSATNDNYAPVNLGQLKAVAKPFYDRLVRAGFNTKASLVAHGLAGWQYYYPWDPTSAWNQPGLADKSVNHAPANLGQVKLAFSFDLNGFTVDPILGLNSDFDGDLIADEWELRNGASPFVDNSADNPDADGLGRTLEFLAGRNPLVADSPVDVSARALDVHSSFGL